jgi:Tol biopolymer transport system component
VVIMPFLADLRHLSPDGSTLLAHGAPDVISEAHLWVVPTVGGGPRRVANIDGQDGAWSGDGRRIAFADGSELFVADSDGGKVHKIATTSGKAFWLRWSPDSERIRFTLVNQKSGKSTLWECKTDGTDLHPLLFSRDNQAEECCGEWTKDGRYFLYRVFRNNHPEIWALRERGLRLFSDKPVRLTQGPLDSIDAVPSRDGRQLLTLEAQERSEVHKLDLKTHQLALYLPGFAATDVRRIPSTDAIAYIESHGRETKVWRCREDGTERLQLTAPPLDVLRIAPSPDGKQIALMAKMPDERWRIYLVPSGGGPLRAVTPENQSVADPTWSPVGSEIMFGAVPDWWPGGSTMRPAVSIVAVDGGKTRVVPGSDDLWSPRWSPDGRYVIAMTRDFTKLMLFDFVTRRWTELANGGGFDYPEWYPNSEYVYVTDHSRNHARLMRIGRASGKQEEVLDLESVNPKAQVCWMITPPERESLLVSCTVPNGDIYALDMDLP